jgi:hypothetical protein
MPEVETSQLLKDHRDVVPFLIDRGLLSNRVVVDSTLEVVDVSRRNRNFLVFGGDGNSYMLKQGMDALGALTVAREANLYELIKTRVELQRLRTHVPAFVEYDASLGILVLRAVDGAQDLRRFHSTSRVYAKTPARAVGLALADLHAAGSTLVQAGAIRTSDGQVPWVLAAHRPELTAITDASLGEVELRRMLQFAPELGMHLERLSASWRQNTVIHQDLKWDNCLYFSAGSGRRRTRVCIVDWETVTVGDSAWDVGSFFADYLSMWVLSMPIAADTPVERLPYLARHSLTSMQNAIAAFWNAYVAGRGLEDDVALSELEWASSFAGARLIQTAIEQVQMQSELSGNVVALIQVAANVLSDPRGAARHLLKLGTRP